MLTPPQPPTTLQLPPTHDSHEIQRFGESSLCYTTMFEHPLHTCAWCDIHVFDAGGYLNARVRICPASLISTSTESIYFSHGSAFNPNQSNNSSTSNPLQIFRCHYSGVTNYCSSWNGSSSSNNNNPFIITVMPRTITVRTMELILSQINTPVITTMHPFKSKSKSSVRSGSNWLPITALYGTCYSSWWEYSFYGKDGKALGLSTSLLVARSRKFIPVWHPPQHGRRLQALRNPKQRQRRQIQTAARKFCPRCLRPPPPPRVITVW